MGMRVSLTCRINQICNDLDTNPFLSKTRREELLLEIQDLVEKRRRLDTVFGSTTERVESDPTCLSACEQFLGKVSLTKK
jgi:hypothetical protein